MTYTSLDELNQGNLTLESSPSPDEVTLRTEHETIKLGVLDAMRLRAGLDDFIADAVGAYV